MRGQEGRRWWLPQLGVDRGLDGFGDYFDWTMLSRLSPFPT